MAQILGSSLMQPAAWLQDAVRAYNAAREIINTKQKQVKDSSLLLEARMLVACYIALVWGYIGFKLPQ